MVFLYVKLGNKLKILQLGLKLKLIWALF